MAQDIDVLLARVADPALRADLERQVGLLRAKQQFGLVFESHLPETVRLPSHPVRRGSVVAMRAGHEAGTWAVQKVSRGKATIAREGDDTTIVPVKDLVVVADFGDAIYPGLKQLGTVDRGGDRPSHVVINGENHHALEALRFSHTGKVDAIYIDPPYNTGARDWKYNNDYVESEDAYRHSKWLAFMQRRLLLARELLNPDDSVLMVTIDEKEVHRLALLLEQTFPDAKTQMVTIVINAPGQARKHELARVEEHAFFLFFGAAEPATVTDDLLNEKPSGNRETVRWESLLRSGTHSRRVDRPALFYPICIDPKVGRIATVGDPLPLDTPRSTFVAPAGTAVVWPLKSDGSEGNWRASPAYLKQLIAGGHVKLGEFRGDAGRGTVWYLGKSALKKIDTGELRVTGRDDQGSVIVEHAESGGLSRRTIAKTVWNRPSHHAGWHGSALVRGFLPGRNFPFPKSLYSVEDALRVAVGTKREAVVLDFFAGSGTTAHAVFRLNRQDGGQRQAILVTNNEVSSEEVSALRAEGHLPGDSAWEQHGIFEHITRPRVTAAITGRGPDGEPVKGDYKFTDVFPMADGFEENAAFFGLTYLDVDDVALDLAFESVAPMLWMRAGGVGPIIGSCIDSAGRRKPYAFTDRYAVLFNTDRWGKFLEKLPPAVRVVFIVTDSDTAYSTVASETPTGVETVRLYENYLSTFSINER